MVSPLEKYNAEHKDRWDILVDFPSWEQDSLIDWVWGVVHGATTDRWGNKHPEYDLDVINSIQKSERIMFKEQLGIPFSSWMEMESVLWGLMASDPDKLLLVIELFIRYVRDGNGGSGYISFGVLSERREVILARLERILSNGSKWKVVSAVSSPSGLIERVDSHIIDVAQAAKNKNLDSAWAYAFGPSPNPEQAIVDAQLAVEHTASSVGLTNATTKVYGTLLGDIKARLGKSYVSSAKPEYDKGLELIKSKEPDALDDQFSAWFANGMDLIQKAHPARHGSKEVDGFKVSVEAARQSVLIATLLNEMIARGHIQRATVED